MIDLGPLIPIAGIVSVAAVMIMKGPFGQALARRMTGDRDAIDDQRAVELENRLEDVQYRLQELEERLDFTERIVAQDRNIERLEGGH
jgi:hypothetical protein